MSALRSIRSDCGTYTVRPGDTLSAIASAFHTTVADLVRTNQLGGMRIVVEQQLVIPGYPCQTFGGMQDVPTNPTPAPLPLPPPGYHWVLQFGRYVLRPLPTPTPIIQPSWGTTDRRGMQDAGTIENTPVYAGDQVKVYTQASYGLTYGLNGTIARTNGILVSDGYLVIGWTTSWGFGQTGTTVLVQLTRPSTVAAVAADVNYAMSAGGFSVSQEPGAIRAEVFMRGQAGQPIQPPGVTPTGNSPINYPNVPPPAGANTSVLDDLAGSASDLLKVPITAGVIAVVAAITLLIIIKT